MWSKQGFESVVPAYVSTRSPCPGAYQRRPGQPNGPSGANSDRTDQRRATEVDVAVHALNRMLELGRPESVRIA